MALLSLVPFALLAAWARLGSPAPWETEALVAVAVGPGLAGDVTRALNPLGNIPIWAFVVGLAAAAAALVRGAWAALLVALSFASDVVAFGVKLLVERDRPENAAVEQFFGTESFSYPSGHTVRAAALAAVVIWIVAPPRWRVPLAVTGAVVAGAVMGFARVSLGVHWPTDAVGGTLLGLGWFAVSAIVVTRSSPGMQLQRGHRPGA